MKKIFIAGVPGMGKTTVGNYLKDNFDFIHFDFEENTVWPIRGEEKQFVDDLVAKWTLSGKDVVVTWGFGPAMKSHTDIVFPLLQSGFQMIWLDGNSEAALREYKKRGTVSEELLDLQMKQINTIDIEGTFHPIFYNTFDEVGEFKPLEKIASDLVNSD